MLLAPMTRKSGRWLLLLCGRRLVGRCGLGRVSLIREVDKAADCVVKWFCDYRSANEAEFFVEYCDYGCSDLADLAQKAGGWADYNPWRSSAFFRPAWDRVWSRCIRLGLPWEDLGFVEPGV